MRFSSKGFTLLELVMVIALIGILVGGAIIIIRPDIQLKKARDSQRKTEMKAIQSAVGQYKADKGAYPAFGTDAVPVYGRAQVTALNLNSTAKYLNPIPAGPQKGTLCSDSAYVYSGDQTKYTIFTVLENPNDPAALAAKDPPKGITISCPSNCSTDGYKTFTYSSGSCSGITFNYWVNNP